MVLQWTFETSKPITYAIFGVTIFGGLLTLAGPYIFKQIIDIATRTGNAEVILSDMFIVALIYGVILVVQDFFWEAQASIKRIHVHRLEQYVSSVLMDKISSLDMEHFEDAAYYNTLTKAMRQFGRINDFLWILTYFISEAVSVVAIIGALLGWDWRIVVLAITSAIPVIIIGFKVSETSYSVFSGNIPEGRKATYYKELMTSNPAAIKESKLFGLKKFFIDRFNTYMNTAIKNQLSLERKNLIMYAIADIIKGALSMMAGWLILVAFIQHTITIGELAFYWALLFQFVNHMQYMMRGITELNDYSTYFVPFVELVATQPILKEPKNPKPFPTPITQGIAFNNVSFSYPHARSESLHDISFTLQPGKSVALVGENGSGKTTIIKLLTRLYDPTSGTIKIDDVDIKEMTTGTLRENIGVIFQDFMKYETTVAENIGFGNATNISDTGKIEQSAIKSGAGHFIAKLDQAYTTHLGKTLEDNGRELSLGQWQKIALARAFFKNAPILCLDEPTAAVDAQAEYELFQKFKDLTKDKIAILISHRFSTVRMADLIIVMDKGKIIEQGNHDELMRSNGLYARLFDLQAEGYR